jgi:hypothetical protein
MNFNEGAAPDDFFEFLCFDSEAIHRLAVNRVSRQVAVVYNDNNSVYMYHNVPPPLLAGCSRVQGASSGRSQSGA